MWITSTYQLIIRSLAPLPATSPFDSCHGRVIRNQQNLFPKFLLLLNVLTFRIPMGVGVSLSLSRDGVHGESIISSFFYLIFDPFPWDYDFYVVSVPHSREQVYYGDGGFLIPHRGVTIAGVAPPKKEVFQTSKDAYGRFAGAKSADEVAVSGTADAAAVPADVGDCFSAVTDRIAGEPGNPLYAAIFRSEVGN